MPDRQKKVYVITLKNSTGSTLASTNLDLITKLVPDCKISGNIIETVGTTNMRNVADLLTNCKLKIRCFPAEKK